MKCPRCGDANGVVGLTTGERFCDKCGYTWRRRPPKRDPKIIKLADYRRGNADGT